MLGVKPGNPRIKNTAANAAFTLGAEAPRKCAKADKSSQSSESSRSGRVQSGIIVFIAYFLWCFLDVFLKRTNVEMSSCSGRDRVDGRGLDAYCHGKVQRSETADLGPGFSFFPHVA